MKEMFTGPDRFLIRITLAAIWWLCIVASMWLLAHMK